MYSIYAKCKLPVELILSLFIFLYLFYKGEMFKTVHFEDIVYAILSFIVILELVKMLGQYIFDRRFRITLVLDTFFIFTLRETILIYTNKTMERTVDILEFNDIVVSINEKIFYILIGIVIMVTLLYFRPKYKNKENMIKERRKSERIDCKLD